MLKDKGIIMYDAPEAASLQTVTGWMTADGRFFGQDEHLARFCGATHRRCENNPDHQVHEIRGYCAQCYSEKRAKVFAAMPTKDWAGEPLVNFDGARYFFDADSLRDYLIDNALDLADLRLCICEPNMAQELDPNDIFCDDLSEDGEIHDDQLLAAFDLLNEVIRKAEPLSWS